MKVIVYTEYGPPDVLHLQEVAKPSPKDDEILIRVCAASVNYGDTLARNFGNITASEFNMPAFLWLPARFAFGWRKPKKPILGSEFAGEVEAMGKAVTRFKPGDQVFGYLGPNMGAYAEYLCISESGMVAIKPANLSCAEAAAAPYGAIMATSLLRRANIQPGQKVLINGASGGIGSAAVQLAKFYGAEVTGVCGAPRLDYVKSLGADRVIDYKQADFTKNGQTYDLIFDILGTGSFSRFKNSLKPNGIYLLASFKTKALLQMLWTKAFGNKKVICAFASEQASDLEFVRGLIEAGRYTSVIDRAYPMAQAAEAHRYAESGGKKGNVVITVP